MKDPSCKSWGVGYSSCRQIHRCWSDITWSTLSDFVQLPPFGETNGFVQLLWHNQVVLCKIWTDSDEFPFNFTYFSLFTVCIYQGQHTLINPEYSCLSFSGGVGREDWLLLMTNTVVYGMNKFRIHLPSSGNLCWNICIPAVVYPAQMRCQEISRS